MDHKTSLPLLPAAAPEPVLIPNAWYPVAASKQIRGDRPLPLERLGRRWVLWRDGKGEVACLPAACPHRGADLGLGRVREGEVECPYHGFRFDGQGQCTAIPCEGKDARIPAGLNTPARPLVHEERGLVWMWHGPAAPPASQREPRQFDQAPDPGFRNLTWTGEWPVAFTRVMEGMQDIHHFPFAHRKLDPWRGKATRMDPYTCRVDGELIEQDGNLRRDEPDAKSVARFEISCAFPGLLWLRFGSTMDGVVAICPIDRERTWIWACYGVHSGLGPLVDRLASRLGLWSEFALVQPDDRRMLESSQPQACSARDHALVRSDAAIAAWHKLRREHLRSGEAAARRAELEVA